MKFLAGIVGEDEAKKMGDEATATREQQIADAQIFFEVFGQGRGAEMLELLRLKTVYLSVMEQGIETPLISLNPGEFMAMREGQNALIRWIEQKLKLSQEKAE